MSARRGTHDEERQLAETWRRGDFSAFQVLVENHQKRILNLVFRVTGDYHQACDITQESFVAAWRAGERPGGGFLPWVAGIALLQARERRAAQARRDVELPVRRKKALQAGRPPLDEWLQECLEMLPVELREVIVLRDLEQFSYEQICAILQIRQDLLRARLSRSREMLKNCLRDTEGHRDGA